MFNRLLFEILLKHTFCEAIGLTVLHVFQRYILFQQFKYLSLQPHAT